MSRYALLLRGINLGPHKKVPMPALRDLLVDVGCREVTTVLNTGNAAVSHSVRSAARLAAVVEDAIVERFGFAVAVIPRTPAELDLAIRANLFAAEDRDPSRLVVTFLRSEPVPNSPGEQLAADTDAPNEFAVVGREVFQWCPGGLATTTLLLPRWERLLGVTGTARNWRTALRLRDLL